jgi:hypothetical protein
MRTQEGNSPAQGKNVKEHPHHKKDRKDHPTEPEEDSLDRTIEDSFPASDPPSSIPDPDQDAA